MRKILITGASGFIGSHVAEYFIAENLDVTCLVRRETEFLRNIKAPLLFGDICNYSQLEKQMSGFDCVIHTAAISSDWGRKDDFFATNVQGTLNILKAAKFNGINHVIVTGSVSSYGEENSLISKNEQSPYASHYKYFLHSIFPSAMNFYRDSKAEMTRVAVKFAEENHLNLTIIEPVWVFGEREFNTGFFEYMKTVKSGVPLLPGTLRNYFPVIYAGDLARIFYLAFSRFLPGVNRIIAGNTVKTKMCDIYSEFCLNLGRKKPGNIPKAIAYPVGLILEIFATLFISAKPPLLSRSRVNMFYDNLDFDCRKVKELLNYEPEHSLELAVARTVKWYRDNKLI